ncbi:MAG: hypothetical protein JWM90_408 [Thermoleophilia bacterium]|nr:hypothetical protein [Thermoleophilia bacterium]
MALLAAGSVVLGGCHDEQRLRERLEGPPARLPVEPNQPKTPPAPALLDTVGAYIAPKLYGPMVTRDWPLVTSRVDADADITFRVPESWAGTGKRGRADHPDGTVSAIARATQLKDADISLATYAAQLADGNPLQQYSTSDGHIVYVTRRRIELAATEPDAPSQVFHTAAVSVDGHIVKLDVRYDDTLDWRFGDLAQGIVGTLQVQRTDA